MSSDSSNPTSSSQLALAETHYKRAKLLRTQGKLDEAIDAARRAVIIDPEYADAWIVLGNAYSDKQQYEPAIDAFRRAIALRPDIAEADYNLGTVLMKLERFEEAVPHFQSAIQLRPDWAYAHSNLGVALEHTNRLDESLAAYSKAIELMPQVAASYVNLGRVLNLKGQDDQAIAAYSKAIELKPDYAGAYNELAAVLVGQGYHDRAISAARKAIELRPEVSKNYVNLFYALFNHPDYDGPRLLAEIQQWSRRLESTLAPTIRAHDNDRSPDRKLRIGYISPFFRYSPDAHFIVPLLEHLDRAQFEIYCYSNSHQSDWVTDRLRKCCDGWRDVHLLSDDAAAEAVRSDRIDILTVICGPAGQSMPTVARRPAPVQAAWVVFASGTTGLQTVDYRISDPYVDPAGADERSYSEKTIRLPQTAWPYDPLIDVQPAAQPPALKNGFITFGSLHRLTKINTPLLETWSQILKSAPDSRLLMQIGGESHRQPMIDRFQNLGVPAHRIDFIDYRPPQEYFELYNRIDVVLDSFPYSGHTTALDALWMGVQVVTLRGRTSVGRAAVSALSNLQLQQLIAQSPDEYVSIALQTARDTSSLTQWRSQLRQKMESSPLMNFPQFARSMEQAYREMCKAWCTKT